jgi:HIV-1 Vpr-binding protein
MQTPILIEKRMEHNRFCEQARQLIECVSQTKLSDFSTMEMTQENLWRAAVVSQTRVKFNEKELLQLIYQHLADIGFKKTAKQLVGEGMNLILDNTFNYIFISEAGLPSIPASRIPSTPASLPAFVSQILSNYMEYR